LRTREAGGGGGGAAPAAPTGDPDRPASARLPYPPQVGCSGSSPASSPASDGGASLAGSSFWRPGQLAAHWQGQGARAAFARPPAHRTGVREPRQLAGLAAAPATAGAAARCNTRARSQDVVVGGQGGAVSLAASGQAGLAHSRRHPRAPPG
jgi:hypothetical protein